MRPRPGLHRPTLVQLVKKYGWYRGAELGVDKGILFGMLLRNCPDLRLVGVDTFPNYTRSKGALDAWEQYRQRCELLKLTTREASTRFDDGFFDFVFIDADHSEFAVADDITHWKPKVKPGGWLGGHDYSRKFPGVIKSVDRFFGPNVQHWPGHVWGIWQ